MSEASQHIENSNVLRDALIEKLRASGISISTDWQEGERVLAQENGKSISDFRLMGDFFEKVYFEETSARFNKDLRLIYEEGKNNFQLHCGRPSTLLFNYGVPDREIVLYANKLLSKAKEHGYKIEDVNSLPMSLAYPMAIFNGSYVGSFAILTELDINGRKSIVSIDINKGIIQDVNLITSIYDKKISSIVGWINNDKLLYVNKEKTLDYLSISAPIAEARDNQEFISAANIIEKFDNNKFLKEYFREQRVLGYSKEEIEEKIGPRLTMNNYNDIRKINPFIGFLWSDKVSEFIDYREVFKTPTLDDYYIATKADYEYVGSNLGMQPGGLVAAEHENQRKWNEMVASGKYEHQKSPLSDSEYLLDKEIGDIYRFSNHWGRVASCQWSIDKRYGTEDVEIYAIGKCNIQDFHPNYFQRKTVNPAYGAPYMDALQRTIENYNTLLHSNVQITDAVRKRIEERLTYYRSLKEKFEAHGYRESRYSVRFHQVMETPLSSVLSAGITRQEVERAMDSNLVKQWMKRQNLQDPALRIGFEMIGFGSMLIHEFAKARLGIDNKFEPVGMFNNSWEAIESMIAFAKGKGLDATITDKYDFHFGSEDVQKIMEHPDAMYSEQELAEIEKYFSPAAFEDFQAAIRSLSEAKAITAEEKRIKDYQNGDAVTKAFIVYDIAQRRLFAEHVGDERYFRQQRRIMRADGTSFHPGVNYQPEEGEKEYFKWVLKNDVAKELMHQIATSPVTEKVPLIEMLPSALQRYLDTPSQAERYSLGGKVDSIYIDHSHRESNLYSVSVFTPDAQIITSVSPDDATEEDIRNLFGKDIGNRLLQGLAEIDRRKALGELPKSTSYSLSVDDMEVGGEGMKSFYDKMLPIFMNKYGKQWGIQVEEIDLPALEVKDTSYGKALHSVRVTEQMKHDVMDGQPMFFRNGKHQAYGFVHNGTIYIDPRIATVETPIHEYTHLWAEVLRQRNPQEWSNIVRLMKETPEVWNYVKQSYPHLLTDDQIADEALAQFSGKRGSERLQALADGKDDADSILGKIFTVLETFWKSVTEFFSVHYTSKEDVADRVLYDLLSEVNPLNYKVQEFDGLVEQSDEAISFTLADAINEERVKTNQNFIKDRNELSADEREIQQKAWRAVFHSLSEVKSSSEMPRHTDVPGTSYSASKPIVGANLGRISGIYDQLNTLLREINDKDLSREQFANMLAGSLGLYLDKDKVSRYSEEPIVLRNGEKISLRISNHPALSVNFVRWQNQKEEAYGFVFRDGSKGRLDDDKRVNYLVIDYYKDSFDNASVTARRDLYRDIVNGIKFMLEEGSLEMLPFPDHLNASGRFKEPLLRFRESHPEMLFHEETQINSWNFKEWFGDWEKQQRILKLKNSTDAVISGDEIVLTNDIRQNRKNALAYSKSLRDVYVNKDTGDKISLTAGNSRGGLREILQHAFLDKEHLQSIAAIPQIIENAIFITTEENKDISNYPNVVSFQHYLCGLKIADIDYTVRAVVAVQKNGERYYDHKLSSIEKGKLVELALNGLASPELSSLEEQEDTELLQPTNENRETVKSSVSGYKDKHLFSILQTNCSKVVDENGKPLIVEHGTHADFTVFDINQLGKNSGDNGLFGAGFYFGSKAPGWLNDGSDTYHVMKVYLNIKNPFEISGDTNRDIYTEIKEKLDTPAFRSLTLTGFNGKQIQVGEYIDHIKAVDASISDDPGKIESLIAEDEELAFIHPRERQSVWREHEISRRTGIAVLGLSWQAVISEQLGSREFAAAAKQDGYDGVIVDRGEGYKEYVVFESNQIKSAFNNVGTFLREDNDIRYQLATVSERGNTVFPRRSSVSDREVGQAVVDTLRAMGIAVHTDLLENRRILSEARKDHSESGKIRYMRTQDGHQYGFTYRGENYVDIRMLDGELGVHEYAHLWCEAFRKINPAGWQDVVETISKEEASLSSVRELHPDIAAVDDLVEEVIATYSGKRGNERLRSELERMAGRDPDLSSRWGNIFKNISKAIQDFWKNVGYFFNLSYDSAEEVYDQVMKDLAERVNPMYHMDIWLRSRDASYLEAVTSGNLAKAKELLYEALRESVGNGITPFVSAGGYRQGMQALAHGIKQGDKDSINRAATLIAPLVPADAVLVPAPSHRGTADTMLMLANAVSAQTGTPVADVLKGGIRNSQYEAKRAGGYVIPSAAMGIYLEGDLPSGKMPVVIDNVVNTGNTAEACIRALNGGVVISLAKAASGYSHAASLKSMATVLYDVKGDIIPLSRRFELSKSKFLGYLRPPTPRLQPNHQEPKLHTMEETKSQQTMVAESSQSVPPQAIQRLTEAYERLHAEHPEEMILFKSASGLTAISNDALEIFNSTGWFYEPHEYQGKPLPVLILSTEDYELLSEMDFNLRLVNSPVDIKEFRDQLHQLESVSGYHIVIGEDTRLGGVSGEYHVYFDENFPSVLYVDKIALAAQNGGSSRIIDGVGWFDFRSEEEAHRFVDDVVSMARRSEDMSTIYETFSSAHLLSEAQLLDTPVTHTWSSPESGGAVEILHIFSVDGRDCIMLYENMEDAVNDLNPTPLADLSEENKRIVIDQLLKRSLALSSAKSEIAEESHVKIDDILLRANELGLEHTPVGLKEQATVYLFDGESAPTSKTYSFATVKGDDITLYESPYDVFEEGKGTSLADIPEDAQHRILDMLYDSFFSKDEKIAVIYDKVEVPSYAMSAILNDDYSGIDNPEDEQDIRSFIERYAGYTMDSRPYSSSFSRYPAFGKPTDCTPVFMMKALTPADLIKEKSIREESALKDSYNNNPQTITTMSEVKEAEVHLEEKKEELQQQQSAAEAREQKGGWNIDYSKYVVPAGVTIEKAYVFKQDKGRDAGRWAVQAIVNGERKTRTLFPNDFRAWQKKTATPQQLAVKALMGAVQQAETQKSEAAKESARKQEERKAQQQQEEKRREKEREAQEKSKNEKSPLIPLVVQATLLAGALSAASKREGLWMNRQQKSAPRFYSKDIPVSPFNAMMMGLHSDSNGYNSSVYTTFKMASDNGISVQRNARSLPFDWYNKDSYVNRHDSKDVITKEAYQALSDEDKALYREKEKKQEIPIYNMDQTTLVINKEAYQALIKPEAVEKLTFDEAYARAQAAMPSAVIYMKDIDGNYRVSTPIATEDLKYATISQDDLSEHMSNQVRGGNTVQVVDYEEFSKAGALTASGISALANEFIDRLSVQPNVEVHQMEKSSFAASTDTLVVSKDFNQSAGDERQRAIRQLNNVYRATAAYILAPSRLGHSTFGLSNPLAKDESRFTALVSELSAGVLMARQGLPATLSKESMEMIPLWQEELKDNPRYIVSIGSDLNKTVDIMEKISRGESVDYSVYRRPEARAKVQPMTIVNQLSEFPDKDTKVFVVIRDDEKKSAAVILPNGVGTTPGEEEVSGMNKNRIIKALQKEGFEEIKFYSAEGTNALVRDNNYFDGKRIESVRLKQYTLETVSVHDVSKELDLGGVQFKYFGAGRADDGHWYFNVKDASGGDITVLPSSEDLKKFFDALKKGDIGEVREELANKYYNLVQKYPERNHPDVFMPNTGEIDLNRINSVTIRKDKDPNKGYIMFATIDGTPVPQPKSISKESFQRLFLVADKDAYKEALATVVFAKELGRTDIKETELKPTSEVEEPKDVQDTSQSQPYHRGR